MRKKKTQNAAKEPISKRIIISVCLKIIILLNGFSFKLYRLKIGILADAVKNALNISCCDQCDMI